MTTFQVMGVVALVLLVGAFVVSRVESRWTHQPMPSVERPSLSLTLHFQAPNAMTPMMTLRAMLRMVNPKAVEPSTATIHSLRDIVWGLWLIALINVSMGGNFLI